MKKNNPNLVSMFLTASLATLLALHAATPLLATPKGGRHLEKTEPRAEFVVEKDHRVSVHFYDKSMQPVPAASQEITVIAEAKSGKTTLKLERQGSSFISREKLPPGDGYNVVVQFRPNAGEKPRNYRFKLDLSTCGGCNRAEYGCTCGH